MIRPSRLRFAALGCLLLGASDASAQNSLPAPPEGFYPQPGALDRPNPLASRPSFPGANPAGSPEFNEAERDALKIATALRDTTQDSNERSKLTGQLKAAVEKAFDLRQKQQLADVERLEKQLHQARERVDQRQKLRDRIVERRIQSLIGDDELEWNASSAENAPWWRGEFAPGNASAPFGWTGLAPKPGFAANAPAEMPVPRQNAANGLPSLPQNPNSFPNQAFGMRGFTPYEPFDIYGPPNDLVAALKQAKTDEERSALRARFRARRDFLKAELEAAAAEDNEAAQLRARKLRSALKACEELAEEFADPDANGASSPRVR